MKILKIENVGRESLESECIDHLHEHSEDREGVGRVSECMGHQHEDSEDL